MHYVNFYAFWDGFLPGEGGLHRCYVHGQLKGDLVEAAVLGVPHARWGEVGAAAVVWRGAAVDLSAYLGERLARYKVPQFWTAFEALPRTAAGKVDRLQVRSLLTGGDE